MKLIIPKRIETLSIYKPAKGIIKTELNKLAKSIGKFLANLYDNYDKTRK